MTTRQSEISVSRHPGALLVPASAIARGLHVKGISSAAIARLRKGVVTALVAAGLAVLFADTRGHAQATGPLPYSGGILVTGNYVVGGVDLTTQANPADADGFSTGTIAMSGVPADADIVAAYLFWEAITVAADPSQAGGVKFRGVDVDIDDPVVVKRTSQPLTGATAACWSSGTPLAMHAFRANVLRFLPVRVDKNGDATGKRLVNDADLIAHGLPLHSVRLPVGSGNNIPESAGASLLVIYRDPNPNPSENPLRKIVLYDGLYIQPDLGTAMEQTLQGFYQSAAPKSARLTHIVGSGQPNGTDTIWFNGSTIATDAFFGGSSSERAWSNPTYDVTPFMNGTTNPAAYGETATTNVFHPGGTGGNDCLAWGAVIFSTAVADIDHDGLPDGLEDSVTGLKDPDGKDLPNLNAMGAGSDQKDLFVEVNAMRADPGTKYGSATAPFSATEPTKTDSTGHHHVPTPEILRSVGDKFAAHGIRPHFDIGDVSAFHGLGGVNHGEWQDDYTSTEADPYFIGNGVGFNLTTLARGGEIIKEVGCSATDPDCHFPAYPGTVFWKRGLIVLRDMPVADDGSELGNLTNWDAGTGNASTQRRRFDPARLGLFHYLLYAHARGWPRSLPCLVDGEPAPYDVPDQSGVPASCTTANPSFNPLEFHVPTSSSGYSDLPGGNAMVTLGLWDQFVARPFVRAGTTFHELGHNLELWHGGSPAIWGNKVLNTENYFEPNCKPNYLSSMSYLFQVHGLFDDNDQMHLDYSATSYDALDETTTSNDIPLFPAAPYLPSWFAPAGSALATDQGAPAATRYCSGERFALAPPAAMARVDAASPPAPIDWNGDNEPNATMNQDVNFDGVLSATPSALNGFDDWSKLRLDQTSAQGLWTDGGLKDFSGGLKDFSGGLKDFSGGLKDFSGGLKDFSGGLKDFSGGLKDFSGGLKDFAGGTEQEITFEHAKALGKGRPHGVTACVIARDVGCTQAAASTDDYHRIEVRFTPAPIGSFSSHEVQRKPAGDPDAAFQTVGTTTTTTFKDATELPDGVDFVYRVRGLATDGNSSWSKASAPGTALNDAPVAVADSYIGAGPTLVVAAPGVLGNDTDVDSPPSFKGRRAVQVTGPSSGTLTLNGDGSFSYTPTTCGAADSFTYKADDGPWSSTVPLSQFSNTVRVDVTVSCAPGGGGGGGGGNGTPIANPDDFTIVIGASQQTLDVLANDTDPDHDPLTITSVTTQDPTNECTGAQGPVSWTASAITYTATTLGCQRLNYTISDGQGHTVVGVATIHVEYAFINVQNLPPPAGKTFNRGATVVMKWQWANNAGLSLDSSGASPDVRAFACSTSDKVKLPPGYPIGDFSPAQPGSGNSFQIATKKNSYTWQFSWKLNYSVTANGQTKIYDLPAGTYVVRIKNGVTKQEDPRTANSCDTMSVKGALITVQ